MKSPRQLKSPRQQKGVALLETLIAATLLAIGLLGAVGLQARANATLAEASMRAEATLQAEKLLGLMSNDTLNLPAYATGGSSASMNTWLAETKAAIPNATVKVEVVQEALTQTGIGAFPRSRIGITIGWTRTNDSAANTHKITSYVAMPA